MKIDLDSEAGRLALGFADAGGVRSFFDRAVAEGGFLVTLPSALGFRQTVRVEARSEDGIEFTCAAEVSGVSQTAEGEFATALLLSGWGPDQGERLDRAVAAARRDRRQEAAAGGDPAGASSDPSAGPPAGAPPGGETRGVSPMHAIRSMNPNQRTMLARKANRVERQILLNDGSPQVLQALLANPRLTGKDVLRLVKSTHTTAPLLKRIAEDSRWGQNQEILGLIAKNPKTPAPIALRLLERLRTTDLRFMAKLSSGVRDNIRRAALREYMRRSGR